MRLWQRIKDWMNTAPLGNVAFVPPPHMKFPPATRLEVIDLRPDDVLVLRVPGPLDAYTATELHALLRDKFPNRRCLVLGDNMVLDVLRETKGEGSL